MGGVGSGRKPSEVTKEHRLYLRVDSPTWSSIQEEAGRNNCSTADVLRDRLRMNSRLDSVQAKIETVHNDMKVLAHILKQHVRGCTK